MKTQFLLFVFIFALSLLVRAAPPPPSELSSLSLSGATLIHGDGTTTGFDPSVTEYTATVTNASSVTLSLAWSTGTYREASVVAWGRSSDQELLSANTSSSIVVPLASHGDTLVLVYADNSARHFGVDITRVVDMETMGMDALDTETATETGQETSTEPEPTPSVLINTAAKAFVAGGTDLIWNYFTIEGGPKTVLVQAIGPELDGPRHPQPNALADPVLSITRSKGDFVAITNDDWEDSQAQEISDAWGGSPNLAKGSKSAAILVTLLPGRYTAFVWGKRSSQGVAQVEIYDLDR